MSFLAEAHRDWHTVYGQNVVCPLDCGVGEAEAQEEAWRLEEEEEREAQQAFITRT